MKYENIFFDFDGTLVNTIEGTAESAKFALNQFNINTDKINDIGRIFCGPPLYDTFSKFLTSEEEIQKAIFYYKKYQKENTIEQSKIYEGIEEMLKKLKEYGAKLFVVTIKNRETVIAILKYLDIYKYFDIITGICEKFPKQDKKEMLRFVTKDVELSKSIMIGDRKSDIAAGNYCNLDTIAVLYGMDNKTTLAEANPTYFAENSEDILRIISMEEK